MDKKKKKKADGSSKKGKEKVDSPSTPAVESQPVEIDPAILDILRSPTFRPFHVTDSIILGVDWSTSGPIVDNQLRLQTVLVVTNRSNAPVDNISIDFACPENVTISATESGSDFRLPSLGKSASASFDAIIEIICADNDSLIPPILINGTISHSTEKRSFQLVLPATLNLLPLATTHIEPAHFAELLAETSNFPYSASTQFPIANISDFPSVVQTLCSRIRLQVVEYVPGAASVYARSVKGVHVAGLVKMKPKAAKPGVSAAAVLGALVVVELKCGDRGLVDVLIEESNEFAAEL
ncbi:hypothetical protein HDV05_002022 [Chytridiales sp. JEL 0842]|nr:hypothetical protein HDV05_002022 [Chytridiales sp. JEL 0842]